MSLLNKLSGWYFRKASLPYWCVLALDCLIVTVSVFFADYFSYGGLQLATMFWRISSGTLIILLIFVIFFRIFHTYSSILRYSSFTDLLLLSRATLLASFVTCIFSFFFYGSESGPLMPAPLHSMIILVTTTILMWLSRICVKSLYDFFRTSADSTKKIFIYGAGPGAVALCRGLCNGENATYSLAGFISTDGQLVDSYLMGARVFPLTDHIVDEIRKAGASAVAVSPIRIEHFRTQNELIDRLTQSGISILMMPKPEEWDGHSDIQRRYFKEVEIEDLLPRDRIEIDMGEIREQLRGRSILITGAAGSIGSELVRQIASFDPGRLILIDQAETPMHDLRLWADSRKGLAAETIVASITDSSFMEGIFSSFRPEYVFHAAAYKHVPMMEDNPAMAVRNNVRGTRIIADLAVRYGVRKFVMVSTDKAVNPTSVMGCSKRICEIYCQSLNNAILEGRVEGVTQFVTTRFGNVLGSSGSVIPIFREQIRNGGPVTVTDPEIIRYFMLIPEACKLVLEAGAMGKGGEIFAFDMGKPVRIADLAKRMIALSGADGVHIEYTGLRDGEKLYEEILSDKEKTKPTHNPKIFIGQVREYDYGTACSFEETLMQMSYSSSPCEIVRKMKEIVPEYESTNPEYASTNPE